MKKLVFILIAASSFAACNNSAKSSDENKDTAGAAGNKTGDMRSRNEQTALASVQAFNAHDINTILKDAVPDAVDYFDGSMPPVKGVDSIKASIQAWINAFPDVKGENIEVFSNADGSKVVVTGEWTGTFKNDLMGMKATGKSFKYRDADIFTFNSEGKITTHSSVQWGSVAMMQVGAQMPQ